MNDDDIRALLGAHDSAGAPRFPQGFADRVMARIATPAVQTIDMALARQARRVLPALAAASLVLGAWNWFTVRGRAPSTFSAVLGVVPTSAGATRTASSLGLTNAEAFE